jgi:hypothetical protein
MVNAAVFSVPLPEGVQLDGSDRELLEAIAQAIAGLRHGPGRPSTDIVTMLEADGWEVRSRIGWIADARRGTAHEKAVGNSRGEALRDLLDLTLLDTVEGCP